MRWIKVSPWINRITNVLGGVSLISDKNTFSTTAPAGTLIATLTDPYGAGSTFTVIGTVPAQLALTDNKINVGSGPLADKTTYTIKVRVTSSDSKRETAETFSYTAKAPIVVVPPTPSYSPLLWTNLQRIGFEQSTMTYDRRYRQRSLHLTGFPAKRFRLAFPSWGKPGGESSTPVPFTIDKVAVEINGGYCPVTFNGGQQSGTVDPAADLLFSDWIDPSKLIGGTPINGNFPRDAEIYVRMKASLPNGTIMPRGTLSRAQGQANQLYDAVDESVTSDVYGTGSFTGSPASAALPNGGTGLSFFIIGEPAEAGAKAAIVVGDSISLGSADSAWSVSNGLSNKVGYGYHDRATADGDNKNVLALVHSSLSGEKQDQWFSRANRLYSLFPFINIVHDQFGTNDIGATSTPSRTLSEMQTTRLAFWKKCRDLGVQRILTTPILPRVTPESDLTSPTTQTVVNSRYALGGQRDQFNDWLLTQVGVGSGPDMVVDINTPVSAPSDKSKWGGPYSNDGCHPLTGGMRLMSVPLREAWLTITVDGVAVTPIGPKNTAPPVISGTPEVGQTLTRTSAGQYSATPQSVSGQWRRDSTPISNATGANYTLTNADIGINGIDYEERAVFSSSTVSTASNSIGPVTAAGAPTNTAAPVLSGTAQSSQTLSVTNGTWNGTPTGYSYQWYAESVRIDNATNSTYRLTDNDIGKFMNCEVTATNASGSRTKISNAVGPVTAAAGGPAPGTVIFEDTFTSSTDAVSIASRPSDSGHTYGRNSAIGQSGAIIRISATYGRTYTSTVPVQAEVTDLVIPSPNYNVFAEFDRRSSLATNCFAGFRQTLNADTGYSIAYINGSAEWRLYKFGTAANAGILATYASSIGNAIVMVEVNVRNIKTTDNKDAVNIKIYIGGTLRFDFTDSVEPLLSAGTVSHRLSNSGPTPTTGIALTSLKVISV